MTNEAIQQVEITRLHESKTNTRRTWGDLKSLAENVRTVGILQPLMARPNADGFELVFGHRRFRAAKIAKLETVPVVIRELSDQEAVEAQVTENASRTDLHPIEEAEAFEQLRAFKWSIEEIADKFQKSTGYVYGRCKLLELCKDARKAFYEGTLSFSTALLVARVPHEDLQRDALKALTKKDYRGELPSSRDAFEIISRRFMLKLADAPFPTADAQLIPKAGACSTCPKRTGNQPELFSDVASKDVCTDPKCWESKRLAGVAKKTEALEEKGVKVVVGVKDPQGINAFELKPPSGYVTLDAWIPGRGHIAGAVTKETKRAVMFDGHGKPVEVVRLRDVPTKKHDPSHGNARKLERHADNQRVLAAKATEANKITREIHTKIAKGLPPDAAWRLIAAALDPWGPRVAPLKKKLPSLKGRALVAAVFGLAFDRLDPYALEDDPPSLDAELVRFFKIDAKARIEAAAAKVAPKKKGGKK